MQPLSGRSLSSPTAKPRRSGARNSAPALSPLARAMATVGSARLLSGIAARCVPAAAARAAPSPYGTLRRALGDVTIARAARDEGGGGEQGGEQQPNAAKHSSGEHQHHTHTQEEKEAIAMERFGKPFDQLTTNEKKSVAGVLGGRDRKEELGHEGYVQMGHKSHEHVNKAEGGEGEGGGEHGQAGHEKGTTRGRRSKHGADADSSE